MSSRARVLLVVTAVTLLAGVVALTWQLPDRSVRALQRALASGEEDAVRERVDFEALREHLKRQLLESFTRAAPDARFAMAASRFVGTLVDGLVTPASLARLGANGARADDVDARWRDLSSADVVVRGEDGRESRWLLARRGLSFVLVGIELPRELTGELERQWSERLASAGRVSAEDTAQIAESSARACAAWRKNALATLQALTQAQRAHHAAHARYADDVEALGVSLVKGPELYDFVVGRADEGGFTLEARGKALMEGDVLEADERGIRVVRDLCARAAQ